MYIEAGCPRWIGRHDFRDLSFHAAHVADEGRAFSQANEATWLKGGFDDAVHRVPAALSLRGHV